MVCNKLIQTSTICILFVFGRIVASIIRIRPNTTHPLFGTALVKKCMEYEVEGARPRGRPKKTWRLWKKTVRHMVEQEGCHGSYLMDEADKGQLMITIGVSG